MSRVSDRKRADAGCGAALAQNMKISPALLAPVLLCFAGCLAAPSAGSDTPEAEDPYSGRAWISKFEACMCETEAPLVFYDGVAYLYNRSHDSLRRIGAYEIRGGSAIIHDFRGIKTEISCSLQADGKMRMSVNPLVREIGWVGFRDRDLMPWSLPAVTDGEIVHRAKKLIEKEKKRASGENLRAENMKCHPLPVSAPAAKTSLRGAQESL